MKSKQYYLKQAEEWQILNYKEAAASLKRAKTVDDIQTASYNFHYEKTLLESIRKQIAQTPIEKKSHVGRCPRCHRQVILLPQDRYCANCGQKIKGV